MKDSPKIKPPRWAGRLLAWYCKPELLEDLQGDLHEYFERNLRSKGPARAKLIYIIDVFKFFRGYTVRKPEFINLLIHWIMIGSYIKTSGRSILRNKLFSVINIAGLAVSMSVGLLFIAFLSDLLSYDSFHEKKDRIYRVITGSGEMHVATTSVIAGMKIRETFPDVESLTIMRRGFGGDAITGTSTVPIGGFWADESFFNVFSFPLLQGDKRTALKAPYSIVLTEKTAKKIFGDVDVLGQSLKFDTTDYIITGVLKDIPKLSHMRFDALVSFSTIELEKPDTDGGFLDWKSVYMSYVYLTLPEHGDPELLQENLNNLCQKENALLADSYIALTSQPLSEVVIGSNLGNPIGPFLNKIGVSIMAGLAFVVILSASFNYMNLSIARSLRRSREVGIRKVIGALKSHVFAQFMIESVIISLCAMVISFLIFLLLRIEFMSLHHFVEDLVSLELSPRLIAYFVLLALAVGLLSGFLPALVFSKINAIKVLKDASSVKVFRHLTIRKALIVVQYVFSLVFITTTIVGYNQYKNFIRFDLGFKTDNILNIGMQGNKAELLKKELSELPEVTGISQSLMITSLGSLYGMTMKYANDSASVFMNITDEHYLPLHEHRLLAGRNFMANAGKDLNELMVNEQVLRRFNIADNDPAKALDEEVILDGKKFTIVGVLRDFHYGTLQDKIEPFVIKYSSEPWGYLNVKIGTDRIPETMEAIRTAWKKIDKVHPLDASFYDDQIEQAYSQFSVMIKVIGFLAFLAVCIASMGLFGMVVFTTETRLKEISIRKVLGASERGLIFLLSRSFLVLLTIAALIALPATYLLFDRIILNKFAYHQPVGAGELLAGFLMIMALAFVMIGSQTLKVARTNPANVLKSE